MENNLISYPKFFGKFVPKVVYFFLGAVSMSYLDCPVVILAVYGVLVLIVSVWNVLLLLAHNEVVSKRGLKRRVQAAEEEFEAYQEAVTEKYGETIVYQWGITVDSYNQPWQERPRESLERLQAHLEWCERRRKDFDEDVNRWIRLSYN